MIWQAKKGPETTSDFVLGNFKHIYPKHYILQQLPFKCSGIFPTLENVLFFPGILLRRRSTVDWVLRSSHTNNMNKINWSCDLIHKKWHVQPASMKSQLLLLNSSIFIFSCSWKNIVLTLYSKGAVVKIKIIR